MIDFAYVAAHPDMPGYYAVKRNRFNYSIRAKGDESGRAILTEQQVLEILRRKDSTASLSREYGVHFMTISCIRKNKSWKHIGRD